MLDAAFVQRLQACASCQKQPGPVVPTEGKESPVCPQPQRALLEPQRCSECFQGLQTPPVCLAPAQDQSRHGISYCVCAQRISKCSEHTPRSSCVVTLLQIQAFWKGPLMFSFCIQFIGLFCATDHNSSWKRCPFCRESVF